MGSFSNYWENEVLDHLFGKGVYAPPTIYVALSAADPGENGSGLDEPDGNGYARACTAAGDWNAANGGLLDNANRHRVQRRDGRLGHDDALCALRRRHRRQHACPRYADTRKDRQQRGHGPSSLRAIWT